MSRHQFTDRDLASLFYQTLVHYKFCMAHLPNATAEDIYDEMYAELNQQLTLSNGWYVGLDADEKTKVLKSFDAIFTTLPVFHELSSKEKESLKLRFGEVRKICVYSWVGTPKLELDSWQKLHEAMQLKAPHSPVKKPSDSASISVLDILIKLGTVVLSIIGPVGIFVLWGLPIPSDFALMAYLWTSTAALAILAVMSVYSLVCQWADGIESLYHGEGWVKPLVMLATSLIIGVAAITCFSLFPGSILIMLAMYAPDGIIAFGMLLANAIGITAIGASVGAYIGEFFSDLGTKNPNALDPVDSLRFGLTEDQTKELQNENLDPVVVKCAIIALRAEISHVTKNDGPVPGFFNRQEGVQDLLKDVRSLKEGTLVGCSVSDLHFDCSSTGEKTTAHQPNF